MKTAEYSEYTEPAALERGIYSAGSPVHFDANKSNQSHPAPPGLWAFWVWGSIDIALLRSWGWNHAGMAFQTTKYTKHTKMRIYRIQSREKRLKTFHHRGTKDHRAGAHASNYFTFSFL